VLATLWFVLRTLISDRIFHANVGSSSVSLLGGYTLAQLPAQALANQLQAWVLVFATAAGGLCSVVMAIYTVVKIRALLSDRRRNSDPPFRVG